MMIGAATAAGLVATAPSALAANSGSVDAARQSNTPIVIDGPVPAGFSSWIDVLRTQQQLHGIADRISAAAVAPGGEGFSSVVLDTDHHRVQVYWKGATPSS